MASPAVLQTQRIGNAEGHHARLKNPAPATVSSGDISSTDAAQRETTVTVSASPKRPPKRPGQNVGNALTQGKKKRVKTSHLSAERGAGGAKRRYELEQAPVILIEPPSKKQRANSSAVPPTPVSQPLSCEGPAPRASTGSSASSASIIIDRTVSATLETPKVLSSINALPTPISQPIKASKSSLTRPTRSTVPRVLRFDGQPAETVRSTRFVEASVGLEPAYGDPAPVCVQGVAIIHALGRTLRKGASISAHEGVVYICDVGDGMLLVRFGRGEVVRHRMHADGSVDFHIVPLEGFPYEVNFQAKVPDTETWCHFVDILATFKLRFANDPHNVDALSRSIAELDLSVAPNSPSSRKYAITKAMFRDGWDSQAHFRTLQLEEGCMRFLLSDDSTLIMYYKNVTLALITFDADPFIIKFQVQLEEQSASGAVLSTSRARRNDGRSGYMSVLLHPAALHKEAIATFLATKGVSVRSTRSLA